MHWPFSALYAVSNTCSKLPRSLGRTLEVYMIAFVLLCSPFVLAFHHGITPAFSSAEKTTRNKILHREKHFILSIIEEENVREERESHYVSNFSSLLYPHFNSFLTAALNPFNKHSCTTLKSMILVE